MSGVVLDASVIVKWFRSEGEPNADAARKLRFEVQAKRLLVIAPPLLYLELVNVAARRWHWEHRDLQELARALTNFDFSISDPPLNEVVNWTARGLTSYDATYVALAQMNSLKLVTDDRRMLEIARSVAISPTGFNASLA